MASSKGDRAPRFNHARNARQPGQESGASAVPVEIGGRLIRPEVKDHAATRKQNRA